VDAFGGFLGSRPANIYLPYSINNIVAFSVQALDIRMLWLKQKLTRSVPMQIQSRMKRKFGSVRNFSPPVGQVDDLPTPSHSDKFGFVWHFSPAAPYPVHHFSSLLCTFPARLFRAAPGPLYTSTERVTCVPC